MPGLNGCWARSTRRCTCPTGRSSPFRAVELDPAQPLAGFQLGLLRLTRGDMEGTEQVWRGLEERPAVDPLRRSGHDLLLRPRRLAARAAAPRSGGRAPAIRSPTLPCAGTLETVLGRMAGTDGGLPAATAPDPKLIQGGPTRAEASVERHLALSAYAGGVRP